MPMHPRLFRQLEHSPLCVVIKILPKPIRLAVEKRGFENRFVGNVGPKDKH